MDSLRYRIQHLTHRVGEATPEGGVSTYFDHVFLIKYTTIKQKIGPRASLMDRTMLSLKTPKKSQRIRSDELGVLLELSTVKFFIPYYGPQRSCKGYVFTPVCQLFCSQGRGVCLNACWDTTPEQAPPPPQHQAPPGADTSLWDEASHRGRHPALGPGNPPWEQAPPGSRPRPRDQAPRGADPPPLLQTATVADGAHPTGMHSCYIWSSQQLLERYQ